MIPGGIMNFLFFIVKAFANFFIDKKVGLYSKRSS